MNTPLLYFHTLRHLRPVQIAGRVWFTLYRPRPQLGAAPQRRSAPGTFVEPVHPESSLPGPGRFRFLNEERSLERGAWEPPDASRLWVYHLHYFDDLNAREADARRAWHQDLLSGWVAGNPPGRGVGWEPYPLSRRIVNWVKWAAAGGELTA
ncbi:MAG TPA: hypothetical protein VMT29_02105, partial [Steroidobacteraceae bacterium]|nr:hypothetical protein [Steroidobacteraceae bacterium]